MRMRRPDGSSTVIQTHAAPAGGQVLAGYRQVENRSAGTTTRIHSEGYRVMEAREFRSRQVLGGPTYVSYHSGLRAATAPGGRTLYRDNFVMVRNERVIRRTVYGNVYAGAPVFFNAPLVRTYYPVAMWGSPYYVYRPALFDLAVYGVFVQPLVQTVVVISDCVICPGRVVTFAAPVASYSDPVLLMGDLQITTAFAEGMPAMQGGEPAQVEFEDVRKQLAAAQQQLRDGAKSNDELRAQLAGQGGNADLKATVESMKVGQTLADTEPVQVPEEVRVQVRQQVRLAMAQHQNGHLSALPDIVSSGYARIYLFQAAQPINVVDSEQGAECLLNTGDLIRFESLPTDGGGPARMRVVTSRGGSCQAGRVVDVPLVELQEMLNGFYARMEDNMKRVRSCGAAPGICLKA
jgi:hypothetical protein